MKPVWCLVHRIHLRLELHLNPELLAVVEDGGEEAGEGGAGAHQGGGQGGQVARVMEVANMEMCI